jgi:hypothetical protein
VRVPGAEGLLLPSCAFGSREGTGARTFSVIQVAAAGSATEWSLWELYHVMKLLQDAFG